MSYIGKTPTIGNFQVCDAISVVNGQAAYTMQVDSVNVVPESANHMLVSLNGILQKPGSSFTVSGSTITFASALSTGDVIDFITLLGNVLDLGVPSDATVTNAKTNFTSTSSAAGLQIKGDGTTDGTLQLNCSQNSHGIKLASPAHSAGQSYKLIFPAGNVTAGKVLKVDSVSGSGTTGIGTLTFGDAGSDFTPNFFAHQSSNQSINTTTDTRVVFDTELYDSDNAFTNTSGNYKFTVPSGEGGKYALYFSVRKNNFTGNRTRAEIIRTRSGSETSIVVAETNAGSDAYDTLSNFIVTDCNAADEFHIMLYHTDSGSRSLSGNQSSTFFGGYKLI